MCAARNSGFAGIPLSYSAAIPIILALAICLARRRKGRQIVPIAAVEFLFLLRALSFFHLSTLSRHPCRHQLGIPIIFLYAHIHSSQSMYMRDSEKLLALYSGGYQEVFSGHRRQYPERGTVQNSNDAAWQQLKLRGELVHASADARVEPHRLVCETETG